MKLNQLAFAALLAVGPMAGALAQGTTGPLIGSDSHKDTEVKDGSATTTTGTSSKPGDTAVQGSSGTVAGDGSTPSDAKTAPSGK